MKTKITSKKRMIIIAVSLLLSGGICLFMCSRKTVFAQAPSQSERADEQQTKSGEISSPKEIHIADLTGTLSEEQLNQVRSDVLELAEYMEVFILYEDKYQSKSDGYKDAFGMPESELYHKTCLAMEIYLGDGFGSWHVHSQYPDNYDFLDESRLSRLICEACLEKGDPVAAVGESAAFVLSLLKMNKLDWENDTSHYTAIVADYSNTLSEAEMKTLLDKMKDLTDYGSVLISIGTFDELVDTSGMICVEDKYVQEDMSGTPPNLFRYKLGNYQLQNKDLDSIWENIFQIYVNRNEAGIICPNSTGKTLRFFLEEKSKEEGTSSFVDTDSDSDAKKIEANLDELSLSAQKKAIRLAEEGNYVDCAEAILEDVISSLSSITLEKKSDDQVPEIRIELQDVTIMDNTAMLDAKGEKKVRELMEQLAAYGKAAFVSYYNNEVHYSGRDRTYGKSPWKYLSEDLKGFNFFSGDGIVVVVDYYHGDVAIYRNGNMQTAISGSYAKRIEEKAEKYLRGYKVDESGCVIETFSDILKIVENSRKTKPLKVITYLLLAISASLMTGLFLALTGRSDQYPNIADLTSGDFPNYSK